METVAAVSVDPSTQMVPNQLASLVPTYDPSKDDLQVYCQKVELLCATWPESKFGELATRLILGCQGTAFVKLQLCKDEVTKNERKSIQRIIELLGGQWGQIPLEKKFEAAERALFRCSQRSDETNDSYLARADVLWQELTSKNIRLEELQAYIVLRGSNLGPEDKKKVLINSEAQTSGTLSMKEVSSAIRFLGAGFFHEVTTGKKGTKLRTYDSTALLAEEAEFDESQVFMADDDSILEDEYVEALVADGDDDALLVSEFETAASEVIQEDAELASAYSAYTDARKRLAEKFRHRGFFPSSHSAAKGKGRLGKFGSFGSKGKPNRSWGGQRKNLQSRILNSNCRLCGKRGHWKAECPNRGSDISGGGPSSSTTGSNFAGVAVTDVPDSLPLEFLNLQEFGSQALDDSFLHIGDVFHVESESMDAKHKLREILKRVASNHNTGGGNPMLIRNLIKRLHIRNRPGSTMSEPMHRDSEITGTLPKVIAPRDDTSSSEEIAWVAQDLSMKAEGVLDSGATKTVIGSQLVGELIKALHPDVKNKVFRSKCDVTFRFGNLNTLEAQHALVIPIGPVNLHVAIVPGRTPFLISNTLMRALKAIVDTHSQKLHSHCFQYPIPLRLSPRGLFLLDINELVLASVVLPSTSKCQDTFVAEDEKHMRPTAQLNADMPPSLTESPHHEETCVCNEKTTKIDKKDTIDKEPIGLLGQDIIDSQNHSRVMHFNETVSATPAAQDRSFVSHESEPCDPVLIANHGQQGSCESTPTPSCPRGRGTEGRSVEVQHPSTPEHGCGFWKHSQRQIICHHVAGTPRLGQVVPPTLRSQSEGQSPSHQLLLSAGDRTMRTGGKPGTSDRRSEQPTTARGASDQVQGQGEDASQESGSTTSGASALEPGHAAGVGSIDRRVLMGTGGPFCGRGLRERDRSSLCSRDQHLERSDECHRELAEPSCRPFAEQHLCGRQLEADIDCLNLHAGDIDWEHPHEQCFATQDLGSDSDLQHFRRLIDQFTKELEQHSVSDPHKIHQHDLFEVFCGPNSQLTHQCVNLSGKAQRFNRDRCDLQSREGRSILFYELQRCKPENVWIAPECKPWCAFSNLNGSQSIEKWEELQQTRRRHFEQLALGIVLYRFQRSHGKHLHWEQPRGSLMFKLPILRELFEGTAAAEFDMCQFGLIDPQSQSPLKKGMIVMTTSRTLFHHLHGRTCQGKHEHHQRIEGSTQIGNQRILRSQFSENYPRKFARSVMIQLLKCPKDDRIKADCLVSLARSLNPIDDQLKKKPRLSVFRAKSEASRVSEPSTSEPAKRRRLEIKQNPATCDQIWKSILEKCSQLVPRVGKKAIEDPEILKEVQTLIDDKRVCFLVAGRGIDRTMPPCKEVAIGEAPFRKSVFIHRTSGKLLIEDEWEKCGEPLKETIG